MSVIQFPRNTRNSADLIRELGKHAFDKKYDIHTQMIGLSCMMGFLLRERADKEDLAAIFDHMVRMYAGLPNDLKVEEEAGTE